MDYLEMIQNVIDTIEENIGEKMFISELAEIVYCSEAHFSRIFHSIVGTSVMDYIRKRRLSLAGLDIAFAKTKVIDTAFKFGYETHAAFTKAFKKYHGVSPIECKKTCSFKYYERFFPTVIKIKMMRGETVMSNFGSPLNEIIADLDQFSANMYYCFNYEKQRYAVKALEIIEITNLNGLYLNSNNELCLFLRGFMLPVTKIDSACGLNGLFKGKHNILICGDVAHERNNKITERFGLICEGNPELKIAKSTFAIKEIDKPYINEIGIFKDEEVKIISIDKLQEFAKDWLATSFDETEMIAKHDKKEKLGIYNYEENSESLDKLEYLAYEAELLATNAALEAARGMQQHKGTMVVAYELHQLSVEIAKTVCELRDKH